MTVNIRVNGLKKRKQQGKILTLLLFTLVQVHKATSHGRLMNPPARNSQWRFGYPNPVNYNDNELFCGGQSTQWNINGGRCGVCGDAWNLPTPRPHEDGGEFGNGIIVRRYTAGQDVDVAVDLTANHMGTFTFKLCGHNGKGEQLTQECFDKYPLMIVNPNGTLSKEFYISRLRSMIKTPMYSLTLRLPLYLTCTNCVLQWTYRAGNGWGMCPDGTGALGCGPQETFVNCADIAITTNTGSGFGPVGAAIKSNNNLNAPKPFNRIDEYEDNPYLKFQRVASNHGNHIVPIVVRSQVCVPTGLFRNVKGMDKWCQRNCLRYPTDDFKESCPADKCKCLSDCDALPPFARFRGSTQYCLDSCLVFPSKCPRDKCHCH